MQEAKSRCDIAQGCLCRVGIWFANTGNATQLSQLGRRIPGAADIFNDAVNCQVAPAQGGNLFLLSLRCADDEFFRSA